MLVEILMFYNLNNMNETWRKRRPSEISPQTGRT